MSTGRRAHGRVLVIDIGTTGTRAAITHRDATVSHVVHRHTPPITPFPGLVEFDPAALAATALDVAREVLAAVGPVDAVGVTTQRASTVLWDRASGQPIGPGIGWQDLRTLGECISAKSEHGLALAPNQTATKAAWLLNNHVPNRDRDVCIGTIDSWLVWNLTEGREHVTDRTNAAITGLVELDGSDWSDRVLGMLGLDRATLPRLVDSTGGIAAATALAGAPLIAGIAGDQQASLIGQGCVHPGLAKCTFGTGGMLDMVTGGPGPTATGRLTSGTFPIVAWSRDHTPVWGVEAIMLTAGSNIEWLVDDLRLLDSPAQSHELAASVPDTGGVLYVPALIGLGTPRWDYGARGTLLGVTRGTTRAHVVRAVLEGVAQRGADLVDAAEADGGLSIPSLRIDGGMSANPTFVQALADATGRPVEVAPYTECTTLGAGLLAGLAVGLWDDLDAVGASWRPRAVVEPRSGVDRAALRATWAEAIERSATWIPALSALDF